MEPDELETQIARAVLAEEHVQEQQHTIDALVAALERMSRVARVELGQSRPDIFEQANAALALARANK